MTHLKKSALSLCALVLTAGALTLIVPRAAHAVAAALVQVTNTAANPAITQGTDKQAAQLVEVGCGSLNSGLQIPCGQVLPDGASIIGGYTVPANQSLVVTSVDILSLCSPVAQVDLFTLPAQRRQWFVTGPTTAHFAYPSGFVLAAGKTLTMDVLPTTGSCGAFLNLNGYLTAN